MGLPGRDITVVDGLTLPHELVALIEAGMWPHYDGLSVEQCNASYWHQHAHPLVSKNRVQAFAPEEGIIVLLSPPFKTIQSCMDDGDNSEFFHSFGALDEIAPELTIILCNFEIGSDSCVALDYRQDAVNPSVIRLKWLNSQEHMSDGRFKVETHWVPVAPTFEDFAEMLGLAPPKR